MLCHAAELPDSGSASNNLRLKPFPFRPASDREDLDYPGKVK
jgi:hypothetical protein